MYINVTDIKTIMKMIDELLIEEELSDINKKQMLFVYELLECNLRCYYHKLQRGVEKCKK